MTEEEYLDLMQEIEGLMDAAPGSEDERRLVYLSEIVGEYEDEHYPINMTVGAWVLVVWHKIQFLVKNLMGSEDL